MLLCKYHISIFILERLMVNEMRYAFNDKIAVFSFSSEVYLFEWGFKARTLSDNRLNDMNLFVFNYQFLYLLPK